MDEQCGLCPPCRMETNQIVHILQGVLGGKGPGYDGKLEKITSFTRGKGKCSLIEMAAAPVMSAVPGGGWGSGSACAASSVFAASPFAAFASRVLRASFAERRPSFRWYVNTAPYGGFFAA